MISPDVDNKKKNVDQKWVWSALMFRMTMENLAFGGRILGGPRRGESFEGKIDTVRRGEAVGGAGAGGLAWS